MLLSTKSLLEIKIRDHIMSSQKSASGLADPSLLNKIDKLFACKVGEYVDLPQVSTSQGKIS